MRILECMPHNILVFHNWNFLTHKNTTLWVNVTCKIWSQFLSKIKFEISTPKRKPSSFLTLGQTWSTELKKQRYWLPSNGYGMMIGDNLWSLYSYFFCDFFLPNFAWLVWMHHILSNLYWPHMYHQLIRASYYMVSTSFI